MHSHEYNLAKPCRRVVLAEDTRAVDEQCPLNVYSVSFSKRDSCAVNFRVARECQEICERISSLNASQATQADRPKNLESPALALTSSYIKMSSQHARSWQFGTLFYIRNPTALMSFRNDAKQNFLRDAYL